MLRAFGKFGIVCDQHQTLRFFTSDFEQQIHDRHTRRLIEIARWFIGQHQWWIID